MLEYTTSTLPEFIRRSDITGDLLARQVIFRGQPIRGSLLPNVARLDRRLDTEESERKALNQLRLLGASLLPDPPESDLDLMVRAQHFGLTTRLLDWTANPLAALWFACTAKDEDCAVYVYGLEADTLMLSSSVYSQDPFSADRTRVLQPRLNNPRVIAQHGWFTLHHYSKNAGCFVALEDDPDTKNMLYEYCIPADARASILLALDRHGINARTLFPDLAGLCRHLNWRQSVA